MPSKWYYEKGGVRKGPVSSDAIRKMVADGTLLPTDLLWKEGMKDWMPAGKSSNLFPHAASKAIHRTAFNAGSASAASVTHQHSGKRAGSGYGLWTLAGAPLLLIMGAVTTFVLYRSGTTPQTGVTAETAFAAAPVALNGQDAAASSSGKPPAKTKSGSGETQKKKEPIVFLGGTTITPAEAKEVVDLNPAWGISFDQLEELTPDVAAELSKYKGLWIAFRKPTRIDSDAAQRLCGFKGELAMMGMTEVTPEFCRLFTKHRGRLKLGGVTAITDPVASALGERQGGLTVEHLKAVTETQLEQLLQVSGPLVVSGVGDLRGSKWCESLKGRAGSTILKGNTNPAGWGGFQYQCFRQHSPSLFLENVHMVPDDLARAVADKPGHISFAEDASMSPAAKAIFDNRRSLIDLILVEHLDDRLAEGIATRARLTGSGPVDLSRVRELNSEFKIMEELSNLTGTLTLGLRHLSDYDAEVLGRGRLFEICLPALESISIKALCSLAKAKRMTLNLPTLLSLSDDFVRALEAHEGWLILEGLQSVTDSQVESLARKKGDLKLPENLRLSEQQKAILAARKRVDVFGQAWWREKW